MLQKIRVNDVELNVLDHGKGPVILFVHGFPLDHTMWENQIEAFSSAFRVIAPDLRGFGQSDATDGTATMEQMADDLVALLDQLNVAEPTTLCGLSMGGYIAWQFWRRHSTRLGRVILCDTRAASDSTEVARARQLMASTVEHNGDTSSVAESMIPKLFAPSTLETNQPLVARIREVITHTDPETVAAAQRGMAKRCDFTDDLGRIRQPTLLICGDQDMISPPTEMREISQSMPNARYVEIPAAGHMSPMENPTKFNVAVKSFMAQSNP